MSGSLVMAGEAGSVLYPSTAHGAYFSGQQAAARILEAVNQSKDTCVQTCTAE